MEIHQVHFGRKFYQDKKTKYWISCDFPRIRAHRWIWNNNHGCIPKGYHIHHKDENRSNNDISNLEIIEASRHLSHHMAEPFRKAAIREWAEIIRPMTKKWHASPEGLAWHKLHAIKCNFGNWDPNDYKCQQCGKDYKSKQRAKSRTRFCSNACRSAWRRKEGLDDIEKICEGCKGKFLNNKYAKSRFCTKSCRYIKPIAIIIPLG